jgi:hypothetical protein
METCIVCGKQGTIVGHFYYDDPKKDEYLFTYFLFHNSSINGKKYKKHKMYPCCPECITIIQPYCEVGGCTNRSEVHPKIIKKCHWHDQNWDNEELSLR